MRDSMTSRMPHVATEFLAGLYNREPCGPEEDMLDLGLGTYSREQDDIASDRFGLFRFAPAAAGAEQIPRERL